jgi:hypothetical protein
MKISIDDTEYELFDSIGGAALGDLKVLKASGVTVKSIKAMFDQMEVIFRDGGDTLDLLEDELFLDNIIAVIYLSRRKAGEDITLADAAKVSFQSVHLVMEEEDLDPKDDGDASPSTSTT